MWNRAVYFVETGQERRLPTEKDCREMQTLLVMGGVTFFITIVIVLSKLEMSSESVMNYAPLIWLIGVIIFGAIINLIDYYKLKGRNADLTRRQVESLLAGLPLPESFPCLLPGPHDECCGGRGIPSRPLPTYDELIVSDETTTEKSDEATAPPPDYSTALTMLQSQKPTE